jgi:hypothetical protein
MLPTRTTAFSPQQQNRQPAAATWLGCSPAVTKKRQKTNSEFRYNLHTFLANFCAIDLCLCCCPVSTLTTITKSIPLHFFPPKLSYFLRKGVSGIWPSFKLFISFVTVGRHFFAISACHLFYLIPICSVQEQAAIYMIYFCRFDMHLIPIIFTCIQIQLLLFSLIIS